MRGGKVSEPRTWKDSISDSIHGIQDRVGSVFGFDASDTAKYAKAKAAPYADAAASKLSDAADSLKDSMANAYDSASDAASDAAAEGELGRPVEALPLLATSREMFVVSNVSASVIAAAALASPCACLILFTCARHVSLRTLFFIFPTCKAAPAVVVVPPAAVISLSKSVSAASAASRRIARLVRLALSTEAKLTPAKGVTQTPVAWAWPLPPVPLEIWTAA